MKRRSLSNVTFVMLVLQKKKNIENTCYVHEGKKPFKCNICDTSFTEQGTLKRHMASIFEEKKLKVTLVLPTL